MSWNFDVMKTAERPCTDACRLLDCFEMQMLVDNHSSTWMIMHKQQPWKEWLMAKIKSGR